jgi:hypothetical protein
MAGMKTKKKDASVSAFLSAIQDPRARRDARTISALLKRVSGATPRMWGPSIVGYGDVHLRYPSGRELDWFLVGFSPRKPALVLYLGLGDGQSASLLEKLGPHRTGKGCLYLRSLEGVNLAVLTKLVQSTVAKARKRE